ncbi:MAG: ABC transporter permease [bacterium]|nr:ABC transporter permease [bacterium]
MVATTITQPNGFAKLGPLIRRSINVCLRQPALVAGPLFMSAFFLVIYDGQLSSAAAQLVPGGSYVSFLVPLVLLTTAFSGGAISGQLMLRDLDSGYYAAMALTPTNRGFLAAAPMTAGLLAITAQAIVLLLLGELLGLNQPHGLAGVAVVVGLTVVAGGGFLLLTLAAAHVGRNIAAVNAVTYIFFPLSFMTTTFVPREQLNGWMAIAADLNPLTYLLEGMRDALSPGWESTALIHGGIAAAAMLALGIAAVWFGIRHSSKDIDQ